MGTDPTGMFWKELGAYAAGFGQQLARPFVASFNSFKSGAAFKQAALSTAALIANPTKMLAHGVKARAAEVKSEFKAASTSTEYAHAVGGVAADAFAVAAPFAGGARAPAFPGAGDAGLGQFAPAGVPDSYVVSRGSGNLIPEGQISVNVGPTTEIAAGAEIRGTIRTSTAGEIRANGGSVELAPEPYGDGKPTNYRHAHAEGGTSTYSEPKPNPVPKPERQQ